VKNVVCGDHVQGFPPWGLVRAPAAGAVVLRGSVLSLWVINKIIVWGVGTLTSPEPLGVPFYDGECNNILHLEDKRPEQAAEKHPGSCLRFTLVESSYALISQAPMHEVTQHRSTRPAETFGQVVQFLPCHRVKAGIHEDAWLYAPGPMIWPLVRRYSSVSGILEAGGGPPEEW
jgi:hypothetical protein